MMFPVGLGASWGVMCSMGGCRWMWLLWVEEILGRLRQLGGVFWYLERAWCRFGLGSGSRSLLSMMAMSVGLLRISVQMLRS